MILLQDKSRAECEELWAKDVAIPTYRVVEDSYVAYKIEITTTSNSVIVKWRRYIDFSRLKDELENEKFKEIQAIPELPAKTANRTIDNQVFLNERRDALEYFLKCVLLNPWISRANAIRKFIRRN